MPKLELEGAAGQVKVHPQWLPGDLAGIRAHDRLKRPPAGVDVAGVGLLIPAEDGEVLVVPLVAPTVVVVGGVVPEGAVQQVGLHRPEAGVHRFYLKGEVPRAVGPLIPHVERDTKLADEGGDGAHPLIRPVFDVRQLLDERTLHTPAAEYEFVRVEVHAQEGHEVLSEQGDTVVPVGTVDHVRRILRSPIGRTLPWRAFDEDDGVGVHGADLAGVTVGEWTQVIVSKVHRPIADLHKVVRTDQARGAIYT